MEKRLILAIGLSILVLLAWSKLFPPPQRPGITDSTPASQGQALPDASRDGLEDPPGEPSTGDVANGADSEPPAEDIPAIAAASEQEFIVEGAFATVQLTNRGGRVLSWKLRDYTTPAGQPMDLFPTYVRTDELPLSLDLDDARLTAAVNEAFYVVDRARAPAEGGRTAGERVTFTWADGQGLSVTKALTFHDGDYLVDVDVEVLDRGRRLTPRLTVGPGLSAQEERAGRSNYYYASQAIWNVSGEVTRRKLGKLKEDGGFIGKVYWAGLEDQFFTALIVPKTARSQVAWRSVERTPVPFAEGGAQAASETVESELVPIVSIAVPDDGVQVFVGPKKYTLLAQLGEQLEKSVWFSSQAWLAWIVKQIYLGLLWLYANVYNNYGVAIILATVVLRLVLFPVNQYAMVSMKKSQMQMQRLQPKIKQIKNKYKKLKDAQSRGKMNQEMMDLYKREGINPMGGVTGCLPLFAQFPILIGFYNMLTVAVELRGAPFFGWIRDLSVKDPYWITPLLMGVTMFWQQKMAMSKITDPQQLQQQRIMLFMPFFFTFICLQMPAGLVLYWFVNNLLGMGQQWLVNRHTMRLEAEAIKST